MWAERLGELQNYVGQGLSRRDIAGIYGVTRNAVVGACYRLGVGALADSQKAGAMIANERRRRANALRSKNPPAKKTTRDRWVRKAKMNFQEFLFPVLADEPEPLRLSVLSPGFEAGCKWVCDGTDDNCLPVHCGHQRIAGSSYCSHHYSRVVR